MMGNQMASLAVDVTSTCGSYKVTDDTIPELAFWFDEYMNLENCINQQQLEMEVEPLAHTEINNACEDRQMMVQFPQVNEWEDAFSQLCSSSSNIPETFFQEFTQTIYQRKLWTEDCSILN